MEVNKPSQPSLNVSEAKVIAAQIDNTEDAILGLTDVAQETCEILSRLSAPIDGGNVNVSEEQDGLDEKRLKVLASQYRTSVEQIREELHEKVNELGVVRVKIEMLN
ncbi:hypothetical protein ScalyP_jg9122 [Parmales sp. scaly parma]|nr:hypothetical protein ScalyP_jg9122 [Parmales sp. scaly parma]|tara:strand:+ start:41 stop:361 length:321 start_codon:yes stop_codon:yes gene_type:complete